MKGAVEYALKAHEGNPTDVKMKDHYHTVKSEYEGTESNKEEIKNMSASS